MKMERIKLSDWTNLNQSSNHDGLHNEASSNDEMMESQAKVEDDPQRVLHNMENHIEELRDQRMDMVIDKEAAMQILNLILQEQIRTF
jgi:hypothetical protein